MGLEYPTMYTLTLPISQPMTSKEVDLCVIWLCSDQHNL